MVEEGEYIRTEKGTIAKLEDIEFDLLFSTTDSKYLYKHWINSNSCHLEKIIKSSRNIIDLIEVGDYVNGHLVIDTDNINTGVMREIYCEDNEDFGLWNEHINTIVTKEQFTQMEYRVKEE